MKRLISILILSLLVSFAFALEISHAEPPNWWGDMEHDTLKILVFGDDFTGWQASVKAKNVKLIHQTTYDDPHYFGLILKVKKAGKISIDFRHISNNKIVSLPYSIKERDEYTIKK
jgi:cyclomaltodextrinase-like protien